TPRAPPYRCRAGWLEAETPAPTLFSGIAPHQRARCGPPLHLSGDGLRKCFLLVNGEVGAVKEEDLRLDADSLLYDNEIADAVVGYQDVSGVAYPAQRRHILMIEVLVWIARYLHDDRTGAGHKVKAAGALGVGPVGGLASAHVD